MDIFDNVFGRLRGIEVQQQTLEIELQAVRSRLAETTRQLDEDRGAKLALAAERARMQARTEAMHAWARSLLPFVIAAAGATLVLYLNQKLTLL